MDGRPITLLLQAARDGESGATESLFTAVYAELDVAPESVTDASHWQQLQQQPMAVSIV